MVPRTLSPGASDSVCSNAALRRATRRLGQLYDEAIAPSGLKATQFGLLNQIRQLRAPTLRVLADDLVMDLSALSHTLKPLLRDDLVTLVADAADKRAKHVVLTAAGQAKLKQASKLWLRAHTRFERVFGAEQAKALRRACDWIASQEFADTFTGRGT